MALVELIMPKMGESIVEATVLSWLKKPGDKIELEESLLEVATDKVDTEIPSTHAGVLKEVLAKVGAGLSEDEQVFNVESSGINGTLEELRNSKAYADGDPATVAKVTALYRKKHVKK